MLLHGGVGDGSLIVGNEVAVGTGGSVGTSVAVSTGVTVGLSVG